ncbi:hypothetical protein SUDANB95_02564 [Actinosynnema sp. ALI-1.44]
MRYIIKALTSMALALAVIVGVGASPAFAESYASYDIYETNGTKHARVWGTITWKSWNSFNIAKANISDLACDNQPVFWYIDVDYRWTGTKRFHNAGCNTSTYWSNVGASDIEGIRTIVIYVCRDTFIPECDSKAFSNPLR